MSVKRKMIVYLIVFIILATSMSALAYKTSMIFACTAPPNKQVSSPVFTFWIVLIVVNVGVFIQKPYYPRKLRDWGAHVIAFIMALCWTVIWNVVLASNYGVLCNATGRLVKTLWLLLGVFIVYALLLLFSSPEHQKRLLGITGDD